MSPYVVDVFNTAYQVKQLAKNGIDYTPEGPVLPTKKHVVTYMSQFLCARLDREMDPMEYFKLEEKIYQTLEQMWMYGVDPSKASEETEEITMEEQLEESQTENKE